MENVDRRTSLAFVLAAASAVAVGGVNGGDKMCSVAA